MMRLLLVSLLLMSNLLVAAEMKIAVVDMERALFNSNEAKASAQQFQADNAADITRLKAIQQNIASAQEKMKTDGDLMSDDERRKAVEKMDDQKEEYQYYARKMQQQDADWKRSFFQSKLPELEKILKDIIDSEKYDLVLPAGAVIYATPSIDLTGRLLERLNGE